MIEQPIGCTGWPVTKNDVLSDPEHDAPLLGLQGQDSDKITSKSYEKPTMEPRAITSSLRTTISYLRSRGGSFSLLRGFHIFLFDTICSILLTIAAFSLLRHYRVSGFWLFCAQLAVVGTRRVLLSPINLWYMQFIISAPTRHKRSCWEMPLRGLLNFKRVFLPSLVWTIVTLLVRVLPNLSILRSTINHYVRSNLSLYPISQPMASYGVFLALNWSMFLCITIPCEVMLSRIYASTLPNDFETIVPCDRTFGGKVVQRSHKELQRLGMLDALRTFDRASWKRLYKLYTKLALIQLALMVTFGIILTMEFRLIDKANMGRVKVVAAPRITVPIMQTVTRIQYLR